VGTALGIVLAVGAAVLMAFASAAEHGAANGVDDERAGGMSMLVELLRRPLWLLGITADAAAAVVQGAALAVGSLVLVQPLLVTSLLFALPFSARLAGRQVPRRDCAWGAALTVGLAVFLAVGRPSGGIDRAPIGNWVPAGIVAGTWLLVCAAAASRQRGPRRSILVALVTGVLFGIASAMAIGVVHTIDDGVVTTLSSWELWMLVVTGVVGWWLQQSAYQAGAITASLPIILVLQPIVAITLGLTVLHEQLTSGVLTDLALVPASIAIIAVVVALARSAARFEEPCRRRSSAMDARAPAPATSDLARSS
jgi:drug/metabolite transporter (DMT)-like permease